jgi:hypothetical protein
MDPKPTTADAAARRETLHARVRAALAKTGHVADDALDVVARVALDAVEAAGGFGALRD